MKHTIYIFLMHISIGVSTHLVCCENALPVITKVIKTKNCVNCKVCFMENEAGAVYIVKQYKNSGLGTLLATTLCEQVAADIGYQAGIPGDRTTLIPAGVIYEGKAFGQVASLHEHARGIRFDMCTRSSLHKKISLCQKDGVGLTLKIIHGMAQHPDLPLLVALDTFVGNNDRNVRNYFYDSETDTFMGIDLGASFRRDLAKCSLKTIKDIISGDIQLTQQELDGLHLYHQTLKRLLLLNSPESMGDQLNRYMRISGLFDDTFFDKNAQKRWKKFFGACKNWMKKSYESTMLVCQSLDELFALYNYR